MEVEKTELTETGRPGKSLQTSSNGEDGRKSVREEKQEKQEKQEKPGNPARKEEKPARKQGNDAKKAAGSPPAGRQKKAAGKRREAENPGRKGKSGPGRHGKRGRSGTGGGKQPVAESFRHAFDGIFTGLGERNMKIHCTVAVLVVVFGVLLRISVTEWCLCLILFGLIMGLELVNTAVEAVVDLVTEDYHPLAKKAKDTAAGAVLIAAIMAAAAGLIIFIPRLLYVFHRFL